MLLPAPRAVRLRCEHLDRPEFSHSLLGGGTAGADAQSGAAPADGLDDQEELHAVVFSDNPSDGSWGKGSQLALRASLYHLHPVFVGSRKEPQQSIHYRVCASELLGVVEGY